MFHNVSIPPDLDNAPHGAGSRSRFLVLAFWLATLLSCRDIVFDNPLDPNASRDVLKIIKIVETPLSGRGDLMFDGEKLWKIDGSGALTAIDRESGAIIRVFYPGPGTGAAFLGGFIYTCNGEGDGALTVEDPLSGDILNRLNIPGLTPGYLAAAQDRLLIFDMRSSGVFAYRPPGGTAERLFSAAGVNIGGMEYYRDGVLITDSNTGGIYWFTLSGEVKKVFSAPVSGVTGITADSSGYIYLFSPEGKIYKVSLQ